MVVFNSEPPPPPPTHTHTHTRTECLMTSLLQCVPTDEKERAETVSNTQNGQGPARVSMQLQPSLPSGVGGGLAISIRSTSRENLAEAPPPHAQGKFVT